MPPVGSLGRPRYRHACLMYGSRIVNLNSKMAISDTPERIYVQVRDFGVYVGNGRFSDAKSVGLLKIIGSHAFARG